MIQNNYHQLKHFDEIILIKLLGSYQQFCYSENSNTHLFFDNENNSIFRYYFDYLKNDIQRILKYSAIVIIDGEYKIVNFGRIIHDLLTTQAIYRIVITYGNHGYPCFDDSHYLSDFDTTMNIDYEKVEELTNIYLKNLKNNTWDSEKNINATYELLKRNNLGEIPELKQHLRFLKLQRIIEE